MKYYHACNEETAQAILASKEIRINNWERIVYLADSADNAAKFLALRHFGEPITIFEIDGLDEGKIEEQFDHSESFFKCKAYGYPENIPTDMISNIYISSPI